MADAQAVSMREAVWPQDEASAKFLLRNYAAYLANSPGGAVNICLQDFDRELASLHALWSLPHGVLLLAFFGERPVGCVAVKVRHDRAAACEMKRLWVEPEARGHHLGRRLTEAAIAWSRSHGADTLLLDTVPAAMPQAAALYTALGFAETDRHNSNPVAGLQFMQLRLR